MLGIFLDSETNGLNVQRHHIIEIAYKIIDIQTGALIEAFSTPLFVTDEEWAKSDPASLKVNGFTFEELQKGMQREEAADTIQRSFARCGIERGKAVFICQNPSFDRAFFSQLVDADTQEKLNWPYHWLDLASMYWAKCLQEETVKPWETGISKNKIAEALGLPLEADPHKAMNGVDHLLLCYEKVIGFGPERLRN